MGYETISGSKGELKFWVSPITSTGVVVTCYGIGGSGANGNGIEAGGGGGGGATSWGYVSVTGGYTYELNFGHDGDIVSFRYLPYEYIQAGNGQDAIGQIGGLGGTVGVGEFTFYGGSGVSAQISEGGGGGGCASTVEQGWPGSGYYGGPAGFGLLDYEGSGGDGGIDFASNGLIGQLPGGGGGGGHFASGSGSQGADGLITILYGSFSSASSNLSFNLLNSTTPNYISNSNSNLIYKINNNTTSNYICNVSNNGSLQLKTSASSLLYKQCDTQETFQINVNIDAQAHHFESGNIPLFMMGHLPNSGLMPLYIKGPTSIEEVEILPLFLYSATGVGSGLYNNIPLFLWATGLVSGDMPLFLKGEVTGYDSGTMPLWLQGEYHGLNANIPLFLSNSGISQFITLYTSGDGVTPGAVQLTGSMNLYLERGTSNGLSLYLLGPGEEVSGQIPLWMNGVIPVNANIALYTSGVGQSTGTIKLYSHGY